MGEADDALIGERRDGEGLRFEMVDGNLGVEISYFGEEDDKSSDVGYLGMLGKGEDRSTEWTVRICDDVVTSDKDTSCLLFLLAETGFGDTRTSSSGPLSGWNDGSNDSGHTATV